MRDMMTAFLARMRQWLDSGLGRDDRARKGREFTLDTDACDVLRRTVEVPHGFRRVYIMRDAG